METLVLAPALKASRGYARKNVFTEAASPLITGGVFDSAAILLSDEQKTTNDMRRRCSIDHVYHGSGLSIAELARLNRGSLSIYAGASCKLTANCLGSVS